MALSRDQFPGGAQAGGSDLCKTVNGVCVKIWGRKETYFY